MRKKIVITITYVISALLVIFVLAFSVKLVLDYGRVEDKQCIVVPTSHTIQTDRLFAPRAESIEAPC